MVATTIEVAGVWGQREIAARKEGRKEGRKAAEDEEGQGAERREARASERGLVARGSRGPTRPCGAAALPRLDSPRPLHVSTPPVLDPHKGQRWTGYRHPSGWNGTMTIDQIAA